MLSHVLGAPVTSEQVAKLLAGPVGTSVRVEVKRSRQRVELDIQRKASCYCVGNDLRPPCSGAWTQKW